MGNVVRGLMVALVVLAAPALAAVPLDPPAQYLGPIQPHEKIEVFVWPKAQWIDECRDAAGRPVPSNVEGCAVSYDDGSCIVYAIDKPVRAQSVARLIAHEVAHCRGWPSHHPN